MCPFLRRGHECCTPRMPPTVTLCVLADRPDQLRVLLACLQVQTFQAWRAEVLDQTTEPQGRGGTAVQRATFLASTGHCEGCDGYRCQHRQDGRISYRQIHRRGDWGQAQKFEAAIRATSTFVGFPNDDAYYVPRYLELMVEALNRHQADLAYCDFVINSDMHGRPYQVYAAAPVTGRIDVGGFLVRRELLIAHGWPDKGPTGDGALIESLVKQGAKHVRVPMVAYVKN